VSHDLSPQGASMWDRLMSRLFDVQFLLQVGGVALFADLHLAYAHGFNLFTLQWQWVKQTVSLGQGLTLALAMCLFFSVIAPVLRHCVMWAMVGVHGRMEYWAHGDQSLQRSRPSENDEAVMRLYFAAAILITSEYLLGWLGYPTLLRALQGATEGAGLAKIAASSGVLATCAIAWVGLWLGTKVAVYDVKTSTPAAKNETAATP